MTVKKTRKHLCIFHESLWLGVGGKDGNKHGLGTLLEIVSHPLHFTAWPSGYTYPTLQLKKLRFRKIILFIWCRLIQWSCSYRQKGWNVNFVSGNDQVKGQGGYPQDDTCSELLQVRSMHKKRKQVRLARAGFEGIKATGRRSYFLN